MASIMIMTIAVFCAYLIKIIPYMTTNATRLGIDEDKLAEVVALYGSISTVGTYLYWKKKYDESSKPKDVVITTNLAEISDEMKAKVSAILNDIPVSKWSATDRVTFERKTGEEHTYTHHDTRIAAECFVGVSAFPNALIKGKVRFNLESKRHGLAEGANGIEIRYVPMVSKLAITPEVADKVKAKCNGPLDGTSMLISTTAKFEIQLDEILSGYNIWIWVRFVDLQHPNLAGDWSEKHVLPIL